MDPEKWSSDFQDFLKRCLNKDENLRQTASQLLEHEFLQGAEDYKKEFIAHIEKYKTTEKTVETKWASLTK